MSYPKTKKLVKALSGRNTAAMEQEFEEMLLGGEISRSELKLEAALEHDFGADYRRRINDVSDDAMEAIITSGVFNKMVTKVIRAALMEEPKEQYKMLSMVPIETVGECDGPIEDHGVFSDFQAHEVCELEAGPLYGVATDFLKHPRGKQASNGIAFTREALCRDPNGFISQQIPKLRDSLDEWRENKLLDVFIGYTPTYNRSGTLYDTYYAADASSTEFSDGSSGPWINAACNTFSCADDLDAVKDLFWDMTDMVHGREIQMDMDNLTLLTSKQNADRIRPLLLAQAVECDNSCSGEGQTCKYIMSAEVANGITFDLQSYSRLIDRIVLRYGVSRADAENWWWVGRIPEFIGWKTQIAPQVNRCPLGAEECRKRIVAVYSTLVKGYAMIMDPHKGVMLSPCASESA